MGLNFRKSLSIGKLFRINFSKRGVGVSAGVKGARVSLNKDGIRETFSLPGTGLSWSERQTFRKKNAAARGTQDAARVSGSKAAKRVNVGSLVWVALVVGAFLLVRSGLLDPAIAKIQSVFSGSGTLVSASPVPMMNSTSSPEVELSEDPQTSSASTTVTSNASDASEASGDVNAVKVSQTDGDAKATGEIVTISLKDGDVTLSATTKYVASKSGSKFHKPSCRIVSSIAEKNLVEYETRDEAADEKAPCSICNP